MATKTVDYSVPNEFFFRIHHVRPRFKNDIEEVLIYIAEELVAIGKRPKDEFREMVNQAITRYPGNATSAPKTINNWRTEISSLFGFIESDDYYSWPGQRAIELAKNQDLVAFFKSYLYCFQYPGAHIKPERVLEQIENGIHFKPAQYILKMLKYASNLNGKSAGITKPEACHCIFNDLRCTRDNVDVSVTWARIEKNRDNRVEYDQTGDVIRYAGDIIDYMEAANLLKTYDGKTFYLNTLEEEAIIKFIESTEWFSEYDHMITQKYGSLEAVKDCTTGWFSYVNRDMSNTDFATDILSFIAKDETEKDSLRRGSEEIAKRLDKGTDDFSTKDIGDLGESLVHGHECMRVKNGGREDLIHLIKRIPTAFAVGYDVLSVELDERKRFIEVKTTISSKPLHFNKVHLTRNEWNQANTVRDRYFVYRLMISKEERKLYLIQDPVGLYKHDVISMTPGDGADITFDPKTAGRYEELLTWKA